MDQDYLTLHGDEQKERAIVLPVIHYFLLMEPAVHINVPFGFTSFTFKYRHARLVQ